MLISSEVVWKHLEWPLVAELFRFRHGRDRFGFARSTVQLLIRTRTFYTMNQSDRRNHAVELVSNSIVATHQFTFVVHGRQGAFAATVLGTTVLM